MRKNISELFLIRSHGVQAQHTVVLRPQELVSLKRKYDGLSMHCNIYRTPEIKEHFEEMEARMAELKKDVNVEPEPLPFLHLKLADHYSQKVANLHKVLADPALRSEALEIIRGLIEKVILHQTEDMGSKLKWRATLCA